MFRCTLVPRLPFPVTSFSNILFSPVQDNIFGNTPVFFNFPPCSIRWIYIYRDVREYGYRGLCTWGLHPLLCGIKQLNARSGCVVLRCFNTSKELVTSAANYQLENKIPFRQLYMKSKDVEVLFSTDERFCQKKSISISVKWQVFFELNWDLLTWYMDTYLSLTTLNTYNESTGLLYFVWKRSLQWYFRSENSLSVRKFPC